METQSAIMDMDVFQARLEVMLQWVLQYTCTNLCTWETVFEHNIKPEEKLPSSDKHLLC